MHDRVPCPRVEAGADTVHWGFFDAKLKPVLTVDSGDRVVMSSVSGTPDLLPPPPFTVPPALPAMHAANGPQRFFGHMCTGPVAVRGAKAGQVLAGRHQGDRSALRLGLQRHSAAGRRAAGRFPGIPAPSTSRSTGSRMTGRLPWGLEVPAAAVLRRDGGGAAGRLGHDLDSAAAPQRRQHGQQGAGRRARRCICRYSPRVRCSRSATGTACRATARSASRPSRPASSAPSELIVRDDMTLEWPMAETPTHVMTMAFDPDLDDCVVIALRQMMDLVGARSGLDR